MEKARRNGNVAPGNGGPKNAKWITNLDGKMGHSMQAAEKLMRLRDLTIIKTYRFEGESDPSDSSILYIIEANDGLKGYSIDAYGVYSNHDNEEGYDNFIRLIKLATGMSNCCFEL